MANIGSVVHGKDDEIRLVVAALACEGHVLFEDVPGTAKTVLARAIAGSIEGVQFARIQCTPDLQPTDVTGLAIFDQKQRDFEFRPGPVFAHVLLVDEINRAMPKTQSALLEAMAEGQVTVDGETRRLPEPFILLATENPIEHEGTFPLPEAQLDRFFLRDVARLSGRRGGAADHPRPGRRPSAEAPAAGRHARRGEGSCRRAVASVYVDDLIQRWIVDLVRATRDLEGVAIGASVRGTLALEHAARAWALLGGTRVRHPGGRRPADRARARATGSRTRRCSTPTPGAPAGTRRSQTFREAVLERAPRPEMPDSEIERRARCERGRGVVPPRPPPPSHRARIRCHAELPAAGRVATSRARGRTAAATRCGVSTGPPSARLSAARSEDAFIVRERFADESPRVVVVADRRPAMALCPPRPAVARQGGNAAHRGAPDRDERDAKPRRARLARFRRRRASTGLAGPDASGLARRGARGNAGLRAPADAIEQSLATSACCAARSRSGASSSSSRTSSQTSAEAWLRAVDRRWDIVPVVIQDPVWEASFPEVGGVARPVRRRWQRSGCGACACGVARHAGCARRTRRGMRRCSTRSLPRHRPGGGHELRSRRDPQRLSGLGRCPASSSGGAPLRRLAVASCSPSRVSAGVVRAWPGPTTRCRCEPPWPRARAVRRPGHGGAAGVVDSRCRHPSPGCCRLFTVQGRRPGRGRAERGRAADSCAGTGISSA